MKKYILKYSWWFPKTYHLFNNTETEELIIDSCKEAKKISGQFDIQRDNTVIYKDEQLHLHIDMTHAKLFAGKPTYFATDMNTSTVFFKMNYLGHNKWEIETDYTNMKKLATICFRTIQIFDIINRDTSVVV